MNYQAIYNILFLLISLSALGYIIYLLLIRQRDFKFIEEQYMKMIEENTIKSSNALNLYQKSMNEKTEQMLNNVNALAHDKLNGYFDKLEDLVHKTDKMADRLNTLATTQKMLNDKLNDVYEVNGEIFDKIQQKDAQIRKQKTQIMRLKDEIQNR